MKNLDAELEEMAELLKALGHPVRLCIASGLLQESCNVAKMQECLELPQSTVSQHLGILKAKGIIQGARRGVEVEYSIINETAKKIVSLLESSCIDNSTDNSALDLDMK